MEHVAEWDKIRAEIVDWAASNKLIVNTIQPIVSYAQGERAKPVQGEQKSDVQYYNAFVARTGVDDRTAAVGKDLLGD